MCAQEMVVGAGLTCRTQWAETRHSAQLKLGLLDVLATFLCSSPPTTSPGSG